MDCFKEHGDCFSVNMEKYEHMEKLGSGTYATVYLAINRDTQQKVAVKITKLDREEGIPAASLREVALMKAAQHPNILPIIDVVHTEKIFAIVVEYIPDGDLRKALCSLKTRNTALSENQRRSWLKQLLSAVEKIHDKKIIHRDIKPQNILVAEDSTLRLADFGLACPIEAGTDVYSSEVVTLWYRAPELLLGSRKYGPEIDIWSVGCVFIEFFLLDALFRGERREGQLEEIFSVLGTPDSFVLSELLRNTPQATQFGRTMTQKDAVRAIPQTKYLPDLSRLKGRIPETELDLVLSMLELSPQKRISAKNALKHKYFHGFT
ncbi:MAG: CMGC/CDK protein kinase [Amphiamblys sp. WSBS2006]|nr:MAG: CMGC/CDK protein kinase [Amphiamblys sp. WSBS2006]